MHTCRYTYIILEVFRLLPGALVSRSSLQTAALNSICASSSLTGATGKYHDNNKVISVPTQYTKLVQNLQYYSFVYVHYILLFE